MPVIGRDIESVTKDLIGFGIKLPKLYKKLYVIFEDKKRDFALLTIKEQMKFIKTAIEDETKATQLFQLNPFLNRMLSRESEKIIGHNQKILIEKFSISAYGKRLFALYDSIA